MTIMTKIVVVIACTAMHITSGDKRPSIASICVLNLEIKLILHCTASHLFGFIFTTPKFYYPSSGIVHAICITLRKWLRYQPAPLQLRENTNEITMLELSVMDAG